MNINNVPQKARLERLPKGLDFEEKIGNTTYVVNSFFDKNAREDVLSKISRLLNGNEIESEEYE